MKKFLALFTVFFTLCASVQARSIKSSVDNILNNSNIPKSSISISVKNTLTEKPVYELNEKMLMHPASIQKILTIIPAVEELGSDYRFSTKLYSENNNSYLIKLGADPYLTSKNLESLVSAIKPDKIKHIHIDDSIIEMKDWGEGWQWDDDMNTCMPKFNAYNLDSNILSITVLPTYPNGKSQIINVSKYPFVFSNNVITGKENQITVKKEPAVSANLLVLNGTIETPQKFLIPSGNLKLYFDLKLKQVMENNKIYLKESPGIAKLKQDDSEIVSVTHPISQAIDDILKNSNNMVSETLTKIAASKAYKTTGTDLLGVKLFNSYCEKNGINNSNIRLVDASGVSKNNIMNTDFMTEFLLKNKNNPTLKHLAVPGEGTLQTRMIPLKNNLRAKTGTLSDISSITGFLTAKSGKEYAFCIMINDPTTKSTDKKLLEDYLIREMYLKL